MKVVFMGTPRFAVPSLNALADAHEVVGVFTRADAPSGRGSRLVPPPVKVRAVERGIPVFQPATLRDHTVVAGIRDLAPDVICVAAYGMLLPPDVLALPPFGCVNVHASLLPRYRGAAPVERAILAGDAITGVSIMRMEEGLDTGPYALQIEVPIDDQDAAHLTDVLSEVGANALLDVVDRLSESGAVNWTEQNDADATYAPKIARADVAIDPSLTTEDALRRIRASTPRATVRIALDGREMVVLSAVRSDVVVAQGEARCARSGVTLGFADGALEIDRLRPAGRGAMSGAAWVCGLQDTPGSHWCSA